MKKNIFYLIVNSSNSHPNKVFLKDINKEFNIIYKNTPSFIYKLNNHLLKKIIKQVLRLTSVIKIGNLIKIK